MRTLRPKLSQQDIGATIVTGFILAALAALVVSAWPTMLVLGALHHSHGLENVPALGFWQTYGGLFLLGVVGRAFK